MRLQPELTPGMSLPARLPKGFVLGDHVVDGWLRDGGMAAIYRAHRSSDAQRVAVKLQLPSTMRDPSLGERFEREAELLWRVRGSPHVVELLDVGMLDDGRRYLVMEWVDGEDLEELLDLLRNEDRLLSVARACRIGRDVARGLAALHGLGVVHLDLKPANVMIGRGEHGSDEVVLVDFGIAADLLATRGEREETGVLLGTSAYMSPQRARGEAPRRACDARSRLGSVGSGGATIRCATGGVSLAGALRSCSLDVSIPMSTRASSSSVVHSQRMGSVVAPSGSPARTAVIETR